MSSFDEQVGLRRTWCRIDTAALRHNIGVLRRLVGPNNTLAPCVKGNAYGHGTVLAARTFVASGADWLTVDSLHEAAALRDAGVSVPLFVLGRVPPAHAATAVALDCRVMVYDRALVDALDRAGDAAGKKVSVHIKVETGTHRQGLDPASALALAQHIEAIHHVQLEGIATHFANVEDTTNHSFARGQLNAFVEFDDMLRSHGLVVQLRSISNSAGCILWPEACFQLTRPGIAAYGMWPSRETFLSAMLAGRHEIELRPALRWETRVAQLKDVPTGAMIGYGCTFRTTHPTRLAILPVGYYDGYDRGLSSLAHVLIGGQRAPLRGRVCMNMIMVDVTDIPNVAPNDDVVLLGAQGDEVVSAEQLGDWAGTINYEVTARIHEDIPRIAMT